MSAFDGFDAFQRILQESSNAIEHQKEAAEPDEISSSSSIGETLSSTSDGSWSYHERRQPYDLPFDLVRVTKKWVLPDDENLVTGKLQTVICEHRAESSTEWTPLPGRENQNMFVGPLSSSQRPHIPRDCAVTYFREFYTMGRKITEKLVIDDDIRVAHFIRKKAILRTSRTSNHIILPEGQFKDLFFMKEAMERHLKVLDKDTDTIQRSGFKQVLQFIDCPSIWDYEGLVKGPQNLFGVKIGEQTHAPSDERRWQTYVKEKVAIDVVNSESVLQRDYGDDSWLDEHHHTAEAESRPFRIRPDGSSEDTEISAIDIDDYHVICRNDIAAYLLSSRREAVGIQISQLKATVWDENKWDRTLIRQPDLHTVCNVWKSLVRSILSSQTSSDRMISRKELFDSKSGLVMLLHGPRKSARNVALGMTESLHRPLVIVSELSRLQHLSYCALRWSGVLLVEAAERLQPLEYESFSAYPGIILLATDKIESVIDSSYEAIDVVIDLEKPESTNEHKLLRSKSGKLWYEYLVDELPEWIETFGEEELQSISERLASHEKREVRMSKVISTAKMLAQLKKEVVREEHLIQVVRQCTAFDQRIDTRKEE
ncbi:hypothetical protein CcaCcLH18_12502 [Colletotrichum camelliae]|nr:hypothetical protein CcaCcLH18_12502 [Colletotrichum camelliae]